MQHPTTQFFTGWMHFLPPNQQRQSTEGIGLLTFSHKNPLSAARSSCSTLTACVNAGAENGASTAESSQVRRCRADRQHFL